MCLAFSSLALAQKTLPYFYGFENNSLESEGWTAINTDEVNFMGISDADPCNGQYCFCFSSYDDADSFDQYLISPLLDAPKGIVFSFACRASNSQYERYRVGYSTTDNDLSSFTFGQAVNDNNTNWHSSMEYEFPVGTKYIAIHYDSYYEYYFYVDDIHINPPITCFEPTDLYTIQDPDDPTSVSLNWTENGEATSWQICLNGNESNIITAQTNPYTLTNLTPETTYSVKVRADCGDEQSYWSGDYDFMPTSKLVIGSGLQITNHLPTRPVYHFSFSQQIYTSQELGDAATFLSIDFFHAGYEITRDLEIYMVSTNKSQFDNIDDWVKVIESDLLFSGMVTFSSGMWTTIEFQNAFEYDGISNVVLVVHDKTDVEDDNPGRFLSFPTNSDQAMYYCDDEVDVNPSNPADAITISEYKNQIRIRRGDPPTCLKPSSLTATASGNTAVVSWTGSAQQWNLKVNGVQRNNVTNPYTIDNLEYATTYLVQVQADCGNGDLSEWISTNFMTSHCSIENQCLVSYELMDSYGDGWNGATIEIVDAETNIKIASLGIIRGEYRTGSLYLCEGRDYNFNWCSGSYDDECHFVFYDLNEEEIFSHDLGTAPTPGTLYTHTVNCTEVSCRKPKNLEVVGNPKSHSVTLCWDPGKPEHTEWIVAYKLMDAEEYTDSIWAHETPYLLEGLDPLTKYMVKVRTACDENGRSKWSNEVSFQTDEACPGINSLSISDLTPQTAKLHWNSRFDNFDLRYARIISRENENPENRANWLQYDDGTHKTNVGSNTTATRTWGVKYPSEMLGSNNVLQSVSIYENSYNTNNITVEIYSGGENEPQNMIHSQVVSTLKNSDFHEVVMSDIVEFDPSQPLWIVLVERGTYVMSACTSSEPNNNWIKNGTSWTHLNISSPSLSQYGWMIRGKVTSVNFDVLSWVELNDLKDYDYTLEHLEPESEYIAQVQSSCGEDGDSDWSILYFDTPSFCTTPFDILIDSVAPTLLSLCWKGFVEEYEVRYRTIAEKRSGEWQLVSVTGFTTYLDNLVEETMYEFQLRGICDGDQVTDWSLPRMITTPSICTTPFYLEATNITSNAATLQWVGYTDAFNVRHRSVVEIQQVDEDIQTEDTMMEYEFDLSDFSGTGSLAICHYNSCGVSALVIDDIEILNDDDDEVLFEDFENGIPEGWLNLDKDGDGYKWQLTRVYDDIYGDAIGYGDYCLTSASIINNYEPLTPNNWLIIPDVELGGTLMLWARGLDPDEFEEVFGVFVINYSEWENSITEDNALQITGLSPQTDYEFQVQGICEDGLTDWSHLQSFLTNPASSDIEIKAGWNWLSSYKEYDDGSLEHLQEALETTGSFVIIKSQEQFSNYENGSWYGQLATLDNSQLYMVKVENGTEYSFPGQTVNPDNHPITINKGWNWISYLGTDEVLMTEALAGMTWSNNDLIKYQNQFAQYSQTFGWYGSLTTLTPGYGYMYNNCSEEAKTLVYPPIGSLSPVRAVGETTHWNPDVRRFATNLSMMVTIDDSLEELLGGNYEIGAFVNGECRGAARLNDLEDLGHSIAFLSVSGEEGDKVCFRLYDVNADYVLPETAYEMVVYQANAVYGSIETPMVLHFGCTGVEESYSSVRVFPNPTNDKVYVNGTEIQSVRVFNAMGQCLLSEEADHAQQLEISLASFRTGVYTVSILTSHGNVINKIIVRQ